MKKVSMLMLALLATGFAAYAQTPNDCPVDGGLSFLLIAGAAGYGAKKIAEKKKKQLEKTESNEK